MKNKELASTSSATAIRWGLHALATALAHFWVWNLTTQHIDFTIRFSNVGMREDLPHTKGKVIRIFCIIEEPENGGI